jgi:hypothetical protein
VGMEHAICANRGSIRIRQEQERIAPGLTKFSRIFGRIHADRHDLSAAPSKLGQVLFEAP